jgi:hypothetical protein
MKGYNTSDLKEQIARKEAEIVKEKKQVDYWKQYEVKGQHEHSKQIKLLQQELVDMESTFEEMSCMLVIIVFKARTEFTIMCSSLICVFKQLAFGYCHVDNYFSLSSSTHRKKFESS